MRRCRTTIMKLKVKEINEWWQKKIEITEASLCRVMKLCQKSNRQMHANGNGDGSTNLEKLTLASIPGHK